VALRRFVEAAPWIGRTGRVALRRHKTRRSWMGFAHLAATLINLRIDEFSHRP